MSTQQRQPEGGLLQSRGWAVFQEAAGVRVAVVAERTQPIFCHVLTLPIVGRYLYVPRGVPQISEHLPQLRALAARYDCAWIRLEPLEKHGGVQEGVHSPHDMQPHCVLQMDLTPDEDALLAQMKSKTRYNIRLAQKKGVEVSVYRHGEPGADEALAAFVALVAATAQRKGVVFHPRTYYEQMFAHVAHESGTDIMLYVARYDGVVVAANLVTVCGDVATYLHGATSDAHRSVMAPFLLQWRQITDAKKRGCRWYDFGGVFGDNSDTGKAGITRFKKGFAPHTAPLCLPGTYDVVCVPWRYRLYRALQRAKRVWRTLRK